MTGDKSVRVFFKKVTYTLTIQTPNPSNGGTISPSPGQYIKDKGKVVSLTAMPSFGWQIDRWEGTNNDSSTSTTNTVTMTADRSVRVLFKEAMPGTVFTYSGTGEMNTPPFQVESSPWKLSYTASWDGHFAMNVKGKLIVNHGVSAGQSHETYVYDTTGSMYFSIVSAPANGNWTLSVEEVP